MTIAAVMLLLCTNICSCCNNYCVGHGQPAEGCTALRTWEKGHTKTLLPYDCYHKCMTYQCNIGVSSVWENVSVNVYCYDKSCTLSQVSWLWQKYPIHMFQGCKFVRNLILGGNFRKDWHLTKSLGHYMDQWECAVQTSAIQWHIWTITTAITIIILIATLTHFCNE